MARSEALIGAGFALLGGLMLRVGLAMPALDHIEVGPGLFPAIVGGLMLAAGLGLGVRALALAVPGPEGGLAPARPGLFLAYLLAPLAYLALTPWLGFVVTALAVVATLARLAGASHLRAAVLGLVMALVVHLLFAKVMRVPLPYGFGERLLAALPWG